MSQIEHLVSIVDIEDESNEDEVFSYVVEEVVWSLVFSCVVCKINKKTQRGFKRHQERHEEKSPSITMLDVAT